MVYCQQMINNVGKGRSVLVNRQLVELIAHVYIMASDLADVWQENGYTSKRKNYINQLQSKTEESRMSNT